MLRQQEGSVCSARHSCRHAGRSSVKASFLCHIVVLTDIGMGRQIIVKIRIIEFNGNLLILSVFVIRGHMNKEAWRMKCAYICKFSLITRQKPHSHAEGGNGTSSGDWAQYTLTHTIWAFFRIHVSWRLIYSACGKLDIQTCAVWPRWLIGHRTYHVRSDKQSAVEVNFMGTRRECKRILLFVHCCVKSKCEINKQK
jgi:hypothetical protein